MADILRKALTGPTLEAFIDTVTTALGIEGDDIVRQSFASPTFSAYGKMSIEDRARLLTSWLTAEIEGAAERAENWGPEEDDARPTERAAYGRPENA